MLGSIGKLNPKLLLEINSMCIYNFVENASAGNSYFLFEGTLWGMLISAWEIEFRNMGCPLLYWGIIT